MQPSRQHWRYERWQPIRETLLCSMPHRVLSLDRLKNRYSRFTVENWLNLFRVYKVIFNIFVWCLHLLSFTVKKRRTEWSSVPYWRAMKRFILFPMKTFSKFRETEESNECILWLLCFGFNVWVASCSRGKNCNYSCFLSVMWYNFTAFPQLFGGNILIIL